MADRGPVDALSDHVAGLRRYALALTGSRQEAEDLVQETLTRAIAAARTWRRDGNLRAWLFAIMHNAFATERRHRGAARQTFAEGEAPEPGHPAPQLIRLEVRDVLSALAQLPDQQRAALSLIALEEFSYAEAARILEIPMGTLMSRLARGREALRRIMSGEPVPRPVMRVIEGKR